LRGEAEDKREKRGNVVVFRIFLRPIKRGRVVGPTGITQSKTMGMIVMNRTRMMIERSHKERARACVCAGGNEKIIYSEEGRLDRMGNDDIVHCFFALVTRVWL
jgi:hypothetical protein